MNPRELALLRSTMSVEEQGELDERNPTQMLRSQWPVSIAREAKDIDGLYLKKLVQMYAGLSVEGAARLVETLLYESANSSPETSQA